MRTMENKTPIRKKAVETRQRLLMATIRQVAEKGYHSITVDEIAKACGLSTGSAYRYFKNKKEMLIAAIEYCFANIQEFSGTEDRKLNEFDTLEDMFAYALDQFYLLHRKYYGIHEELESLRHIDEDIREVYQKITENAIEALVLKCPEPMRELPDLRERLYVAIGILDHYAHMQMDEKAWQGIDMEQMKAVSIAAAVSVMKNK